MNPQKKFAKEIKELGNKVKTGVCPNGCHHYMEDCLCGCEVCQAWDSGIEEDCDEEDISSS